MNRRSLIKKAGLGVIGLSMHGCGISKSIRQSESRETIRSLNSFGTTLWPVNILRDRIIRTTVGLRPHRPSGFVLKSERHDSKTIVHNYGHGGSGMSLSWGTGFLATELALEHPSRNVAVIGCGVAGLTTARQLQRHGFRVTIYAQDIPPNTTSNKSLASWTPTSGLVDTDQRTESWDFQFRRAADIAYRQLQLLVGPKYGVSWIDQWRFLDEYPEDATSQPKNTRPPLLPSHLRAEQVVVGPEGHFFPCNYMVRRKTLRIEPSIYLEALVNDFLTFRGSLVIKSFDSIEDLMSLDQELIINCTGLGSHDLFNDTELSPLKGQLVALIPQAEVNYATIGSLPGTNSEGFVHMLPRQDGIILGGTSEKGVWSIEPDQEATNRILSAHFRLFQGIRSGGFYR
jgi:D-amino-acid oxidase